MRTRSVIAAAAAAVLAALPGPAAAVDPTNDKVYTTGTSIHLQGHGYGHGIGMSQNGASGAAKAGYPYSTILRHYYPGTTLSTTTGQMRVWLTADDSRMSIQAKAGLKARIWSTGQVLNLWTEKNGKTAIEWYIEPYPWDATKGRLMVRTDKGVVGVRSFTGHAQISHSVGMRLNLPGGSVAYRSTLRSIDLPGTSARRTVNVVSLDNYVKGVLPREMPSSWPMEALKAQSVAARTYGVRDRNAADAYDICDTTSCQVYGGMSAESTRTNQATSLTAGRILRYDGAAAFTQFSASSGGWTAPGSKPYLKALSDGWDKNGGANPNYTWDTTVSVATIESKLQVPELLSITFKDRNGYGDWKGRVGTVVFGYRTGTGTIRTTSRTGAEFRFMLGLKSHWLRFIP